MAEKRNEVTERKIITNRDLEDRRSSYGPLGLIVAILLIIGLVVMFLPSRRVDSSATATGMDSTNWNNVPSGQNLNNQMNQGMQNPLPSNSEVGTQEPMQAPIDRGGDVIDDTQQNNATSPNYNMPQPTYDNTMDPRMDPTIPQNNNQINQQQPQQIPPSNTAPMNDPSQAAPNSGMGNPASPGSTGTTTR